MWQNEGGWLSPGTEAPGSEVNREDFAAKQDVSGKD